MSAAAVASHTAAIVGIMISQNNKSYGDGMITVFETHTEKSLPLFSLSGTSYFRAQSIFNIRRDWANGEENLIVTIPIKSKCEANGYGDIVKPVENYLAENNFVERELPDSWIVRIFEFPTI